MELNLVAAASDAEVSRARRRQQLAVLLVVAATLPGIWLLRNRLIQRYGMDPDAALFAAGIPIAAAAGSCLSLWARLAKWSSHPVASPAAQARAAEWALRLDRRVRPWAVAILVLMLLRTLVARALTPLGGPAAEDGFAFVWPFLMFAWTLVPDLVRPGQAMHLPAEERVRAARQEAVRCGYAVLVTLGGANMVAASFWPLAATRAWEPILILGVLVPQVWMLVRDRA